MTQLRAIIADANRDLGFLDEIENAPPEMSARGLRLLQALVTELVLLAGPAWVDVDVAADYTAGENERIRLTGGHTITRPTTITVATGEGSALAADGFNATRRQIRNFSRLQVIGTGAGAWVYTAELAAWTAYEALGLDSVNPLGPACDAGLQAALATRINRGRGDLDPDIKKEATLLRLRLAQNSGYTRPPLRMQAF